MARCTLRKLLVRETEFRHRVGISLRFELYHSVDQVSTVYSRFAQ